MPSFAINPIILTFNVALFLVSTMSFNKKKIIRYKIVSFLSIEYEFAIRYGLSLLNKFT